MNTPNPRIIFLAAAIFSITILLFSTGAAGTVATPYQIGTWEGFRPAAVSYTFDDACANQYAEAVPMFHNAGLKMTLFTVTSWEGSWPQVKAAAAWGDEIASHTVTHPTLTSVSAAQLTNELANSQSTINSYVTNARCLTLAYPNCVMPSESVTAQYYIAARICSGLLVPSTPSDFLSISCFILGNTGSYTTGASINSLADSAVTAKSWCVYLIHAIDGDSGYSPLSSTALQASVNYTSTNQAKFWVETFGNVVRYIKERNASAVAETANTRASITLQVTNNLDNSIYNYPITLRRPLPAGWPAATVSQNNTNLNATMVTVNATNYVMFDVVPNGGEVVLSAMILPFTLNNPTPAPPGSLTLQLRGQSNATYSLDSSTDLLNWLSGPTNTLMGAATNLTVDASSNRVQFYRARWAP